MSFNTVLAKSNTSAGCASPMDASLQRPNSKEKPYAEAHALKMAGPCIPSKVFLHLLLGQRIWTLGLQEHVDYRTLQSPKLQRVHTP